MKNIKNTSLKVARAYTENEFDAKGKDLDAVLPNFDNNYVKLQKRLKKALDIPRIQMPVIEPSDIALFNQRLNEGSIDIFAPYAKGNLYVPTSLSKGEGEEWVKLGFADGSIPDDKIQGKLGGISVGKMKPTQSQIWLDKIIKLILQFGPARSGSSVLSQTVIVSGDNYLLDGHHRYAQAMIADQGLAMKSLKIPLSIELLLKIGKTYGESIGNSPKASEGEAEMNRENVIASELLQVAKELVGASNLYIVIGNAPPRQTLWPSIKEPKLYSRSKAAQIVKKLEDGKSSWGHHRDWAWHSQPIEKADNFVSGMVRYEVERLQYEVAMEHRGEWVETST